MRIDTLSAAEVPLLLDAAREFYAESQLAEPFDADWWVAQWQSLLANGHAVILVAREGETITGGLGYLRCPDLNTHLLAAVEAFFFVRLPYRRGSSAGRLLAAFEQQAHADGARYLRLSALETSDARVRALYAHRGYAPLETLYQKGVSPWR